MRSCRIDLSVARSIQQGLGLRFCCEDRMFKVNKLFILRLFPWLLQAPNRPVGITGEKCPWLVLANQSAYVIVATNASHIINKHKIQNVN